MKSYIHSITKRMGPRAFRPFALCSRTAASLLRAAGFFLVLAWGTAWAGPAPDLNIPVETFTLENGMLFLVVNRPAAPQVACRLAIRAGSALENSGKTGIAHMLEHMMFKGTKNFGTLDPKKDQKLQQKIEAAYQVVKKQRASRHPDEALIQKKLGEMAELRKQVQKVYVPQAFSSLMEKNGAIDVNAFTTQDQTQYTMSVPADMMEQWFSAVSEQIFEPVFREFYVEREVIQREWAFRYVNNPYGAAWLDLYATAFEAHPYHNPVIGWLSDMQNLTATDAAAFHSRYYNPANAVCVLVGDITAEKAKNLAEIYFARYPAKERSPERVTAEPKQSGPRNSIRYLKGASTPVVRIAFHGPDMGTDDFYALDVATMLLSQGRSARITQNIVEAGKAQSAFSHNPDNRYGGWFVLGGTPNEPEIPVGADDTRKKAALVEACDRLATLLVQEARNLALSPIDPQEMKRVKKLNRRSFIDNLQTNESLASTLATLEVQIGWNYLTTYIDAIEKVTAQDVKRAVETYLTDDNQTTAYVIPGGKPDAPPEPYTEIRSAAAAGIKPPETPENPANISIYPTPEHWRHPLSFHRTPEKIEYPEAKQATVDRTPLFFLPDSQLPLATLQLFVRAGAVDVPEKQTGLDDVLAPVLENGGTDQYDPRQWAAVLDDNAIHLSISVGREMSVITLSTLEEDFEKGVSLLSSLLTHPRLDAGMLEVVKNRVLTGLKRQSGNADAVAGREFARLFFKGHVYGRDSLKALETLSSVTRKDLLAFVNTYFVPANMVAAVSGDISMDRARKSLAGLMQALPRTPAPSRRVDAPHETTGVLAFINKPGQVQSKIRFGLPGVLRTNADYWKLGLATDIFGGSDSMMYRRLRDDLGLVYSAGFFNTYFRKAGFLTGYVGCKADGTSTSILETAKLMTDLAKNGIDPADLKQKRLDTLNSFVFNLDTPDQLVGAYARYALWKEPLNTLEKIQDNYMNATLAELDSLVRKYLNPALLTVVVVADGDTPVTGSDGTKASLRRDLEKTADALGLSFMEIPLR